MEEDNSGEGGKVIRIDGKPIQEKHLDNPLVDDDMGCNEVIAELQDMASRNMLQSILVVATTKQGEPIFLISDQSMREVTFKKSFLCYKINQRFAAIDGASIIEEE